MRNLLFCFIVLYASSSWAQKLELINVDNVTNLPLGQGIELELRLKIDEIKVEGNSNYEIVTEPNLISKFILIPNDTGQYQIGPIICGYLVSNSIVIKVTAVANDLDVYLTMQDSAVVGSEVKLVVTNVSKTEGCSIKDLTMKTTDDYEVVSESYSRSVSIKNDEQFKKETLTVVIRPLTVGNIFIGSSNFNAQTIKGFSLSGKSLEVIQ